MAAKLEMRPDFLFILISILWISGSIRGIAQSVPVQTMKYPWAGGLNSCQFCAIDLNLDGINDLLIFDRHGNRKLTFINQGTPGSTDYRYAPEYASLLPEMHDWVITADYNCDGKMDIFTYGSGGVRVFRNTSSGSLSFHLQTDLLESYYYTGFVGILVTPVDYPAICDIDGDGDLDLLTFFGLGSYVEYHKNLSMETFGNCDSLDYHLYDHCWGKFMESVGGDEITLDVPCPYKEANPLVSSPDTSQPKHTGSTMLATDLNGDGLADLLTGGIYFPNIIQLINGGTRDSAFMISKDTVFPSYDRSVLLSDFPAMSFLDMDNDGIKDLVVSPFDPSYYTAENKKSVWFYKNTGTNTNPHFVFQTDDFFQSEMLDFGTSSFPAVADMNGDGLADLLIGNYGYYDSSHLQNGYLYSYFTSSIAYLKNTGTITGPSFELVSTDIAHASGLNVHALNPCVYDLNNDGLPDLLCGQEDGSLIYFPSRGDSAGIPVFGSPQMNYQQIRTSGFSAPQLFDLDHDGLPDLIVGQQNGTMKYYRNTGSLGNPVFTFTLDSLGKVDVTNHNLSYYGYCTPFFFRNDQDKTCLLSGSDEGKLHLYTNIDGNLNGRFLEIDSLNQYIGISDDSLRIGWRTAGILSHLSDPKYFDLVCGNFSGGLNYFSKGNAPGIQEHQLKENVLNLRVYPVPADLEIRIDLWKNGTLFKEPGPDGSGSCILRLYNIFGKEIRLSEYSPGSQICISSLPDGIYIAELTLPGSSRMTRGKFLVNHKESR
jgi:hypothetical protein